MFPPKAYLTRTGRSWRRRAGRHGRMRYDQSGLGLPDHRLSIRSLCKLVLRRTDITHPWMARQRDEWRRTSSCKLLKASRQMWARHPGPLQSASLSENTTQRASGRPEPWVILGLFSMPRSAACREKRQARSWPLDMVKPPSQRLTGAPAPASMTAYCECRSRH